jgi:GNAT superfamily N-acetyltransferase
VRRAWRRQGIGSRLYESISDAARERGKVAMETQVREDRTDGVDFLRHRGFVEHGRDKLVALDIRGMTPPEPDPPEGITFTTLARRPDLVAGVHAVAVEAFADIPSISEPIVPGTFEEFTGRDVNVDSILKDGFFVAIDDATGGVVGYASLARIPGPGGRAFHDMTAVLRAWRGRGIAGALKRATIAWAIGAGLEVLETGNDTDNAPMRAVNIGLGYQPLPDLVGFRGPLAGAG